MKDTNYTGSKTQNHFTAYLAAFVRGKRRRYLIKLAKIRENEESTESWDQFIGDNSVENCLEKERREYLLSREAQREYPAWDEMSDERLFAALMELREDERKLIYQHVFEELSFEKMGELNFTSVSKVEGVYYYAIRKIRKYMRRGDLL